MKVGARFVKNALAVNRAGSPQTQSVLNLVITSSNDLLPSGSNAAFASASNSPNDANSSSFVFALLTNGPPISALQLPMMSGTFGCLPAL